MSTWLLFAILTPILWGMGNPIDAGLRRNFIKSDKGLTWFSAFFNLPLAILAFFIFDIDLVFNLNALFMILAGMFWTLPYYFYFKSLKSESASRVALLLQLIPLCTLIIAYLFADEVLSNNQLISFFIILSGGILAAVKIEKNTFNFSKIFWFMLIACMMWAASDVGFKYFSPGFDGFDSAFIYYLFGSGLPALLLLLHPKKIMETVGNFKKLPAKAWVVLLFGRSISLSGSLAFTYALTVGKVSLTAVMAGVQPLFALLFGYILSIFFKFIPKEKFDLKKMGIKGLSLVIIIIGLILMQN